MKYYIFFLIFYVFPIQAFSQEVTFQIDIPKNSFSSPLIATLWSAEKIKIRESNSSCTISYDVASKKEQISCPNGDRFQEVLPEKFSLELKEKITLSTKSLKLGENFELVISGKSSDKCNTTTAIFNDVVKDYKVVIKKLEWASTEMACIK